MDEDELLKKQLQNLNLHLPRSRASLAELLKKEKPRIETRDGSSHRFKKNELDLLAEILPKEKHGQLRLPIIIRISPQLGRGAAKISGKVEQEVLRKILDKKEREGSEELLIHRPETRTIRKKLPTTTQYAFLISSSRSD
ncbi:hypothetical protein AKJ55_01730 [candidate division MSBL1 archaeon SCGC-AAA382M17]|uniref:UPF0216 protein AKJ55_01730 n=1 Tax=candidate division MSBL1 archaeon SCGC-AAA382M17 TaxID=1698284 RepID=A0ABR5TJ74_9EURY|nr:hypothetical protein AKJ55_01730 [candidate division MSBL1 archaeon SCGC-AAA382M17]